MKLPDSEPLEDDEYLCIADPWRQEWERGVQVPVNPDHAPEVAIQQVYDDNFKGSFKLNPRKYLHASQDANFQSGIHELTMVDQMAEQVRTWGVLAVKCENVSIIDCYRLCVFIEMSCDGYDRLDDEPNCQVCSF